MTKDNLIEQVGELYNNIDLSQELGSAINRAIESGAVNLEDYNNDSFTLAKAILAVVLNNAADEVKPYNNVGNFPLYKKLSIII